MHWRHRRGILNLDVPAIMGIVNITPDSFSDGGRYFAHEHAVEHALNLIDQGADIIDIGGESTRPGAKEVSLEEEVERVVPVIETLRTQDDCVISIDTTKTEVAKQALEAGADIINDISGGTFEPDILSVAANYQAGLCVTHTTGRPTDMQQRANYRDIGSEIREFLEERMDAAATAGVPYDSIAMDPGFGFGKLRQHNYYLLAHLHEISKSPHPLLIGLSRKRMIRQVVGDQPQNIETGSAIAHFWAMQHGARIIRVHDVSATVSARAMHLEIDDASQK